MAVVAGAQRDAESPVALVAQWLFRPAAWYFPAPCTRSHSVARDDRGGGALGGAAFILGWLSLAVAA